jgi:tagatose 1,6-diphosphate aldolase
MDFEFVDPGILKGDGFELFRFSIAPPDISRGFVPAYDFRIRINDQIVGQVNLRVGLTERIMLYAGNLGYKVDPPYRGRHLAASAIALLLPIARHHEMSELWICCSPENWASRKTCERLGAELIEIIEVPSGVDLYELGVRMNCRYRLQF